MLQEKSEQVNDKLIILYVLKRLEMPVSNIQLMKIVIENRFMSYLTYQNVIKELMANNFISSSSDQQNSEYTITPDGETSLKYFDNRVPRCVINYVNVNLSSLKTSIMNDSHISTSIEENDGHYIAKCSVSENDFFLLDLKLAVGSRIDAQLICNNWKKHSSRIYEEIISSLTYKRENKKAP